MEKQKRLLFARNVFLFVICVCFGVIIVTEKASGLLIPKVEKKMQEYLNTNFSELQNNIDMHDVIYDKTVYKMKITSRENDNHFFYIYYSEKKLSDTYKEDYVEGKQLFKKVTKDLEDEIRKKINTSVEVEEIATLDQFTSRVQDRIIKEEDLLELKFYTIKKELTIDNWNEKEITKEIIDLMGKCQDNNITPKNYKLVITNNKDVTESIEIDNLTEEFIKNTSNEKIIKDILSDNSSKLLKTNGIKYKYLN